MSDIDKIKTTKVEDIKTIHKASPDPMASMAPSHVLSDKVETKGSGIEMGESYAGGISNPGVDLSGLILRTENYITPAADKDYRWCTNDNRRVARSRAKGWRGVRDKETNREIVVGNMTLCERSKDVGDKLRAAKLEQAFRMAHKATAEQVAAANPGLSGTERKETVTRSDI